MNVPTFLGLETALRGILAQQQALNVAGNNIANANTPGYTRRVAVLQETAGYPHPSVDAMVGAGQVGTGVTVAQYQRVRDDFLDVQYRAQTMNSGYYDALRDGLDQVQGTLSEPGDNGISSLLSKFWSSWQDLADNPESTAARQAVLQSGDQLADGFKQVRSLLDTVKSQNDLNTSDTLGDVNDTASQIAELNDQIARAKAHGDTPNDLLDARDTLLDHLSTLVNATWTDPTDIKIGTLQLVSGTTATTQTLAALTGGTPPDLSRGKLAGLVDLGTTIADRQADLDAVAKSLIDQVNTAHKAGFDLDGNAGVDFFSGTGAGDIALALPIDQPSKVAASSTGSPGDGGAALALAALQRTGGIDDAYRDLVTNVGADAQKAARSADAADQLTQSIDSRRQSVMGVSLDEEMTNLVRFQRGFQASARALTAMDSMIETIITRTGRVGL